MRQSFEGNASVAIDSLSLPTLFVQALLLPIRFLLEQGPAPLLSPFFAIPLISPLIGIHGVSVGGSHI